MRRPFCFAVLCTLVISASVHASEPAEKSNRSRPISNPKFDPTAERVDFFEGVESGVFEYRVVAQGPGGGNILVTNTTDEPLSVQMPKAFVTVSVLKQFGGGGLGGGGLGGGGLGGGGLGGGGLGGGGGQQNQGGGLGGGGLGGGGLGGGGLGGGGLGGGGFGGGLQSIPPEKTIKMKYVSVCLDHGKPDPTPQGHFKIVKVEDYTENPVLQELITMIGTGQMAPKPAQAAVWNITDNMSWQQLAAKGVRDHLGRHHSFFQRGDIAGAQLIQRTALARIKERDENPAKPESEPTRIR